MGTRSRQAKAVVKTVSTALCQILCLAKPLFRWLHGDLELVWRCMKMYEDAWSILKYGMGSMGFTCAALVPWVPAGISFILKARTTRLASGSFSSAWQHIAWHGMTCMAHDNGATRCNAVQRCDLYAADEFGADGWAGHARIRGPERLSDSLVMSGLAGLSRQLHRSWAPLSTRHMLHLSFWAIIEHRCRTSMSNELPWAANCRTALKS